ncbi:GIY-YIG nuclease family protein [Methanobrevibacter sp.]|uniref:GIY-YIG nuclease family protein n=1 Tax=Methanobrevibacter sp. TaxID=66852 RepID=UPI00388E91A3
MKGCYCLIIKTEENKNLKIGKKLKVEFKKGFYVYIGSAMNGLESRVKRHLSKSKKLHWHIDYLLRYCEVVEVIYNINQKVECELSKELSKRNDYIQDFGCSDCECNSHLYYFKNRKEAIDEVINAYNSIACPFRIGISEFS